MADRPHAPRPDHETGAGQSHGADEGAPRWVIALGIGIAVALVVLMVLLHLTGILAPDVH